MKKFIFETCFEEELERERQELIKAQKAARVPTFSQQELESARQQGVQKGLEQGRQEVQQSLDAQVTKTLLSINEQMVRLFTTQQQEIEAIRDQCLQTVRATLQRAVPHYMEKSGFGEIEQTLARALEVAIHKPKVMIRVRPSNLEKVKEKISAMTVLKTEAGIIDVQGDEALGPNDIRIFWGKDGGAEQSGSALMGEIMRILDQHMPTAAETPANAQQTEVITGLDVEIIPPEAPEDVKSS